jgi:hemin uptake protein HemP
MLTSSSSFDSNKSANPSSLTQNRGAGAAKPRSILDSTDILQGQTAIEINHNGATYRLQTTRLGKLILTK